jgi:hypothetical protein
MKYYRFPRKFYKASYVISEVRSGSEFFFQDPQIRFEPIFASGSDFLRNIVEKRRVYSVKFLRTPCEQQNHFMAKTKLRFHCRLTTGNCPTRFCGNIWFLPPFVFPTCEIKTKISSTVRHSPSNLTFLGKYCFHQRNQNVIEQPEKNFSRKVFFCKRR